MILTVRVPDDRVCSSWAGVTTLPAKIAKVVAEDSRGWHWAADILDSKSDEQYADECKQPGQSKPKFQIGELVRLKSGGPAMTVENVTPEGSVDVIWFTDGVSHSTIFNQETLQHEPTEAEKQAIENAKRLARMKMDEAIAKDYQKLKAEQLQAEINAEVNTRLDNVAGWAYQKPLGPSITVRPEQLTTHRENATSFIEHSILTTSQFKRILLYIVKHVRFQDDKKGI